MQKTVNIHEAKTHLSRFLKELAAGDEIIIARMGKPVAKIVSLEALPNERRLGFVKGAVTDAFFEPLPEEELDAWES